MNKQDIIQRYEGFLEETGIDSKDFVLGAGGALVMLGLREETKDMDMDVPLELFNKFRDSEKYEVTTFRGNYVLAYDSEIDLHITRTSTPTVELDGVWCHSAEEILRFKLYLNREKDQADIKKLQEYLAWQV